jgi:nitroreductase
MDIFDTLMKRRSVRNFSDRPLPESLLSELFDAANNAPSGGNIQPLSIIVVKDPADRGELAEMVGGQPWVKNAPVSLIFCLDFNRVSRWAAMFDVEFMGERSFGSFLIAYADVICAAQNTAILAEARGLGSVYVGTIQSSMREAAEYFDIPERVMPVVVLSLGYPKSVPRGIPKLATDFVVHRDRYRPRSDEEIRNAFESKYGDINGDVDAYLEKAYIEVVEADKQHEARWADRAKQRMTELGIRSNADFLFRLRYPQRILVEMNANLADSMRESGFDFPGVMSEPVSPGAP